MASTIDSPPAGGYLFDNQSGNTLNPGSTGTIIGQDGSYAYMPNGSGGLNYYNGATPITNTQYGAGTGQNYGALESQAMKNYQSVLGASTQNTAANQAAATTAANDSAINGAIGRLDTQGANGNANIMANYNNAFTTLLKRQERCPWQPWHAAQ